MRDRVCKRGKSWYCDYTDHRSNRRRRVLSGVRTRKRPWVNNLRHRFRRCVKLALVRDVERRQDGWYMVCRDEAGRNVCELLHGVSGSYC